MLYEICIKPKLLNIVQLHTKLKSIHTFMIKNKDHKAFLLKQNQEYCNISVVFFNCMIFVRLRFYQ